MSTFAKFFAAFLLCASLSAALHAADLAPAPSVSAGDVYILKAQVIASGGGRAVSAAFNLTGTVAQATAGPNPAANGGNFALRGGFHSASAPLAEAIFRDGFEN